MTRQNQSGSLTLSIVLGLLLAYFLSRTQARQEILTLPVFYMKVFYTPGDTLNIALASDSKLTTVTPEHIRVFHLNLWTVEETFKKTLKDVSDYANQYVNHVAFVMPSVNLSSTWLYSVSPSEINSTLLAEMKDQSSFDTRKIPYSEIQKELLRVVSSKFRVNLNKVAANLQVTASDLWSTYDANNWEAVVHSIVKESVSAHVQLLQLASNNSLALLVRKSVGEMYNATLYEFERTTFSIFPKKELLDVNVTSYLISSYNLSIQSNSTTIANLAYQVTQFTAQDLGILYQLNIEQVRTIDRTTFGQITYMCHGYTLRDLFERTLINVSSVIAGSTSEASKCPILVTIKGKSMITLTQVTPVNVTDMSVLELLTVFSRLPWRKVYRAISTSLSEWEFMDCVKIADVASLSGKDKTLILDDSVSHAIYLINTLKQNGSLDSTIETHRVKVRTQLKKLLNISTSAVAVYTNTTEADLQKASSPLLVTKFIQATVAHFEITLADINNTLKLTEEELFNLPRSEWQQIVPSIIDAVVKLQAGKLRMSVANMYLFLDITANSSTIEHLNILIATKVVPLLLMLKKFEKVEIQSWLTNSSTQDAVYTKMTALEVILNATGFGEKGISLAYDLSVAQITVLKTMQITELLTYCKISTAYTKTLTPFNLTSFVVGIQTHKPSCTATAFYVSSEVQTISSSKREIITLTNTTASLVELAEQATELPWRLNARWLGVNMSAWTVLDAVSLSNVPGKTLVQVEDLTFQQLIAHSLQLNASGALDSILQQFKIATKSEMYHIFNVNDNEISALLKITPSDVTRSDLTEILQLVLNSLKEKFVISLDTVATAIEIETKGLHNLAPTEWHEMLPMLRNEIIKAGQTKLKVDSITFSMLLQESDLGSKTLTQLESIWDRFVPRLWKGKTYAEGKTISDNLQEYGLFSQSRTMMDFVNDILNVTVGELSLLFGFETEALSVLGNYTLEELPSDCGMKRIQLMNTRPLNLTKAMIGYGDITTCRSVALVTALRTSNVGNLAANFSVTINDTASMLEVWEAEINISWTKILWGFNVSLEEWPIIGAFSLRDYSTLVSMSLSDAQYKLTYSQIAAEIRSSNIDSYLNTYRQELLSRVLQMFTVTSLEVCSGSSNPCTTKIIDVFLKSLTILGTKINFDPFSIAAKLGVSSYEFENLVPSQWHKTVPFIVSESYKNFSNSLNLTEDRLSILLESSTSLILSMKLDAFVPLMLIKVTPLVTMKTEMESSSVVQLARTRSIDIESLQNKTGIEITQTLFNISLTNISFIFGWDAQFMKALENYTVFESSLIMQDNDLSSDRPMAKLLALMATVVPNYTPPPLTCKSGFELNKEKSTCVDKDECHVAANPCDKKTQTCQNYQGGHGCDCIKPGTYNALGKCRAVKVYQLRCRLLSETYTDILKNHASREFYDLKTALEDGVNWIFRKSGVFSHVYESCKIRKFEKGSVIVEMFLYFNLDFEQKLSELKKEFVSGLNKTLQPDVYHLGDYRVDVVTLTITDFDECFSHQDDCHEQATCTNTLGSFTCKCNDGFDDLSGDGRDCKASFLKTMWWIVIIIAFVIVVLIITVVVLILRKPKTKSLYGFSESAKPISQNSLISGGVERERRMSKTSDISYRDGDVYYRDKQGKLVRGSSGKRDKMGMDNMALDIYKPDPKMRASAVNGRAENGVAIKSNNYELDGTLTRDQIENYKLPKYLLRSDHPIDSLEDEEVGDTEVAYWTIREHDSKF